MDSLEEENVTGDGVNAETPIEMGPPAPIVVWSPPSEANGISSQADVMLIGSDGNRLTAHKSVLNHATEVFDALLALPEHPAARHISPDGMAVIEMPESTSVLGVVIPFCYNIEGPDLSQVSHELLMQAYEAANKFVCLRAKERITLEFIARLSAEPSKTFKKENCMYARLHALDIFAAATRTENHHLVAISEKYSVFSFDLVSPLYKADIIGQEAMLELMRRKMFMKLYLLEVLAKAMIPSAPWQGWQCHTETDHGHLLMLWTRYVGIALQSLLFQHAIFKLEFDEGLDSAAVEGMNSIWAALKSPDLMQLSPECWKGLLNIKEDLESEWDESCRKSSSSYFG